jgi:cell division protein FtsA
LTLEEFSSVDLLPSRILLCGGGSSLPEIEETLKNAEWSPNLPFARKPSVHFIRPQDVANVVDQTNELVNPWDITPMSLANLAIDLVGEEAVMDSVLNRIVTSLRE